jgi:hypothetical protein
MAAGVMVMHRWSTKHASKGRRGNATDAAGLGNHQTPHGDLVSRDQLTTARQEHDPQAGVLRSQTVSQLYAASVRQRRVDDRERYLTIQAFDCLGARSGGAYRPDMLLQLAPKSIDERSFAVGDKDMEILCRLLCAGQGAFDLRKAIPRTAAHTLQGQERCTIQRDQLLYPVKCMSRRQRTTECLQHWWCSWPSSLGLRLFEGVHLPLHISHRPLVSDREFKNTTLL